MRWKRTAVFRPTPPPPGNRLARRPSHSARHSSAVSAASSPAAQPAHTCPRSSCRASWPQTDGQDARPLAVASLISRSPLVLPPLTPFEAAYYNYQKLIHNSLSQPVRPDFFFRPGSVAAAKFANRQSAQHTLFQELDDSEALQRRELVEGYLKDDIRSLERLPDRTLYLLICKESQTEWHLPHSQLSEREDSLSDSALRTTYRELGPNLDIWPVGRFPATVFKVPNTLSRFKAVWIMPQRVLRGQVNLPASKSNNDDARVQTREFGWLSRQEIQQRVSPDLWSTLEPIMNA